MRKRLPGQGASGGGDGRSVRGGGVVRERRQGERGGAVEREGKHGPDASQGRPAGQSAAERRASIQPR